MSLVFAGPSLQFPVGHCSISAPKLVTTRQRWRLLVSVFLLIASTSHALGVEVRTWLDENTAVTVTAQKNVSVFAQRQDTATGSYFDFAGMGAFEINQMGKRTHYISLLVWSTSLRTRDEQKQFESKFESFVIWADGQPVTLKLRTRNYSELPLSAPIFKFPGATRLEMFYPVSLQQLALLAAAKKLWITPTTHAEGQQSFKPPRDPLPAFVAFVNEIAKTNPITKPE